MRARQEEVVMLVMQRSVQGNQSLILCLIDVFGLAPANKLLARLLDLVYTIVNILELGE